MTQPPVVSYQALAHLDPEPSSGTAVALSTCMIDPVNAKYGRGTVKTGAEGVRQGWQMRRELMSPGYLNNWKELLEVK
jgi:hypothetical protein